MGLFNRRISAVELEQLKAEIATLRERLKRHDDASGVVDELSGQVAALRERPDPATVAERIDALSGQLSDLDRRVTSVSTELANQLNELGNDIDGLAARPPADGPDPATVETLRDGQVRLANEQARYQIAFRDDLAKLAEHVKRTR